MNDWNLKNRPLVIAEADDFMNQANRNGLDYLFYWKAKYPKFKITLFTIPDKTTLEFLNLINFPNDWIELAIHGFTHDSNFECWEWDEVTAKALMKRVIDTGKYVKIFKAPGWMITDKTAGYVASEHLPVSKDSTGVYRGLSDFIIVDRHYNKEVRPKDSKIICIDCQPDIVHMHTWPMVTGDLAGRNGFPEVEEIHGVPWDDKTEFKFISEAYEEGLIKPCV